MKYIGLKLKILLKPWTKDGTVKMYHSSKTRRIYAILKADDFLKAYLKVSYGKIRTNSGKLEEIINDGDYETRDDLLNALKAFTENDLLDDTKLWIKEG